MITAQKANANRHDVKQGGRLIGFILAPLPGMPGYRFVSNRVEIARRFQPAAYSTPDAALLAIRQKLGC